jgi:hypothetical protein
MPRRPALGKPRLAHADVIAREGMRAASHA